MRYFMVFILAVFMGGCAYFSTQGGQNTAVSIAVQYATIKAISDSSNPEYTAARAKKVLENAIALLETGITIETMEGRVRESIAWSKLDVADRLLVNQLIFAAREDIKVRTGADSVSILTGAQSSAVKAVLADIRLAVDMSGYGSSK